MANNRMMDLEDRYLDILEKLSMEGNYIAIQMCRLGIPELSKQIKTACVAWDETKKKVKFLFNKKFSETLNEEELQFVIAHESIHLLNGHVSLLKNKIEEMQKFNKKNLDIIKFKRKFNIAADCVVNDSLVNLYGFPKVLDVKSEEKPKIVYGMDFVGRDCHDLSVMDVFYMLDDDKLAKEFGGDGSGMDIHDWSSFFDEDGNLIEEFADQIKGFYQKNAEDSAMSDDDLDKIAKLKKHFEENTGQSAQAGDGKVGAYRAVDGLSKISVNWNKLFYDMVEVKKQQTVWNKPNKKLISVYPDVLLPVFTPEEKEEIFIAIDASASIDYKALSLFINVVKGIATKFKIKSISFDEECYSYDIKKDQRPQGGGGTNFQIIEDWIQTNLKKYPKAVFVLTDGDGTHVYPEYMNRWCFVLYGSCSTKYCRSMKNYKIKDLLK